MEKAVMDMGAAMHATLVVVGDKLGLYKAMAGAGWLTPAELAAKTSTAERYVREWLNANAASGYVTYDASTQRYELATRAGICADGAGPARRFSHHLSLLQGRTEDHAGLPHGRGRWLA
jgi:DNA-binding IclR family transcriptional regulator